MFTNASVFSYVPVHRVSRGLPAITDHLALYGVSPRNGARVIRALFLRQPRCGSLPAAVLFPLAHLLPATLVKRHQFRLLPCYGVVKSACRKRDK